MDVKTAIKQIRIVVDLYGLWLRYLLLGPLGLTRSQLKELFRSGLVDPGQAGPSLTEAYMEALFDQLQVPSRKHVRDHAIRHLNDRAGVYIDKWIDRLRGDYEGIITQEVQHHRQRTRDAMREELPRALQERLTVKEIGQRLAERTEDYERDWTRIVNTELAEAHNLGAVDAIIENNKKKAHDEIYCYKIGPSGHDPKTCLVEGESVLLRGGVSIPVERLAIGDKLIPHTNIHERQPSRYTEIVRLEKKNTECIQLELDNGRTIRCSVDHPILIRLRGFYFFWRADSIPSGADIVNIQSATTAELKKISCHLSARWICRKTGCSDLWDFTQKKLPEIIEMRRQGKNLADIGFMYGDKKGRHISVLLDAAGIRPVSKRIPPQRRELWLSNIKQERQSRIAASSERIISEYKLGKTTRQIGRLTGVSQGDVCRHLKQNGFSITTARKYRGGLATWAAKTETEKSVFREWARRRFIDGGHAGSSRPQRECFGVLQTVYPDALMGYVIDGKITVDMLIPSLGVVIEYDGSGHDLQVRLGKISAGKQRQNDYARDALCKTKGYRVMRLNCPSDLVPSAGELRTAINTLVSSHHSFLKCHYV